VSTPPDPKTQTPRSIVFQRLARQSVRFPDLAIESKAQETKALDERDRAFARALELGTIARWRSLQHLLESCLKRSWGNIDPKVRGVLLAGAAQILLMEAVPDHAAVDEAVNWTKKRSNTGAGGFVNGVLRSIIRLRGERLEKNDPRSSEWWLHWDVFPLENGEAWLLTKAVFPEEPTVRLGVQASLGDDLVLSWIGTVGWEATLVRAAHCLTRAPINVIEADGTNAVWEGSHRALADHLREDDGRRIQDRVSAMSVNLTGGLNPEVIVDFCAGRGTKTHQLNRLHPNARILASDPHDGRRAELQDAFADVENVEIVEPRRFGDVLGKVDLLVLDVPCSNSGVLPRRSQARYRFNNERLRSLIALQKSIVEESLPLLREGAHVLYATCSLEKAENEKQVDWISRRFDAEVVRSRAIEPSGLPGDDPSSYTDGGFHALLTRDSARLRDEDISLHSNGQTPSPRSSPENSKA